VGKTGFAIDLAQHFGGEIVGADSMQIYRGLDIGTAKPTATEQATVTHHMVDIVEPGEDFDAAEYSRRADSCVEKLIAEGRIPFVVGGTGLYIKALIYGLAGEAPSDSAMRHRLAAELARVGAQSMHQRLSWVDPQSAQRIHPNDTFRVLRALEVFQLTGRPLTTHHTDHAFARPRFHPLQIGLTLPRAELYARIDQRVDAMLSQGLVNEVRDLLAKGIDPRLKSMQSLGYRHLTDYLQGHRQWDETVRTLKRDHRRYAKRQMTWFSADNHVQWMRPDQLSEAFVLVEKFLMG
jgi:tRNA dimethylallyltransferase